MNTSAIQNIKTSEKILTTVKKNYLTYLKHYELKRFKPMTFEEFSKNYFTH